MRKAYVITSIVGGTLVLMTAIGGITGPDTVVKKVAGPTITKTIEVPGPVVTTPVPGPTVTVTVTETKEVKPAAAGPVIDEGTWTVGTDIQPGKYRVRENVAGDCYWEITKSGSNGSTIVQNDIVQGGRPTVTLSGGQDFKTARCGSWEKVG